ncbi:MAG: DUF2871 domain-containing protein [Erysipelotrichaceae bacterium]|nr:DUF2871 domain-containing protein [Erysipelotrichaceae bacterium]MDY5252130.1 DUF2871 domain-containing protein [Erysipelotrichaceae bacterium]
MKKFINIAFIYAILAMISGVFYREFTKFMGFSGVTSLAFTHLHFFVLGTIVFLILALFAINTNLLQIKGINKAITLYNIGLPFMVSMFYVRGIVQVLELALSSGANAAISGIAGISHIILGVSIIWLLTCLKKVEINK